MIGQIFYLLLLLTFAVAAYMRYGDLLYPAFLQAAVWLFVMASYFCSRNVGQLSFLTYYVLLNGVLAFGVGALIATRGYRPVSKFQLAAKTPAPRLLQILFWLSLILFPFFVRRFLALAGHGPFFAMFVNARVALVENLDGGMGLLAYALPLSYVSAAAQLLWMRQIPRGTLKFALALALALCYAFLSTGRTFLLMLLALLLGIASMTRRISLAKTFGFGASLVILAFVSVAVLTGKGTAAGASMGSNLLSLTHEIQDYVIGSLPALDRHIKATHEPQLGENSFRTVFALAEKLGFDTSPANLVKEYSWVPFPTNVYTVYRPYFDDFSFAGLALVQILFGILHGCLYRRADSGSPLFVCLYALSLYPLLMQFFQDQYFSLLSQWVQFVAIFALVFLGPKLAVREIPRPSEAT